MFCLVLLMRCSVVNGSTVPLPPQAFEVIRARVNVHVHVHDSLAFNRCRLLSRAHWPKSKP